MDPESQAEPVDQACGGCGKRLRLYQLRIGAVYATGRISLYHHDVVDPDRRCGPVIIAGLLANAEQAAEPPQSPQVLRPSQGWPTGSTRTRPPNVPLRDVPVVDLMASLERYRRLLVLWAYRSEGRNIERMARRLNIGRGTLVAMLRRWRYQPFARRARDSRVRRMVVLPDLPPQLLLPRAKKETTHDDSCGQ